MSLRVQITNSTLRGDITSFAERVHGNLDISFRQLRIAE
jgi:hypothetical protein